MEMEWVKGLAKVKVSEMVSPKELKPHSIPL
jgi:hypothetical protein